ncbi:hypothetical protein KBZ10_03405 [Streptomyces sp. F63]|uniref:hypothetical protein n=1 Tax=Streptomyces sp. F63 TaxID=2824887 RepID=UPI001B35F8BE|nr:hypothetical protein [Streptomyces sp. F63]MBQ0983592.1 hypothetical protein [Streptomyces sp. F63]
MGRHEQAVDQIVFRWDAGNTLGTTGFGPVAWSCDQRAAEEFFHRAAALLRSTAAETVPAVIRLEKAGQALLVHRFPWPGAEGQRSSTVCHALLGPSGILYPELCLGLSRWTWAGSGLPLGDVRGSLEAVHRSVLEPSADEGGRRLLAGLPEAGETLTAVAAEFLRNPGQAFTVLDREGGDSACRVLWGLHGIFSELHPRDWTFATHDTAEDRAIRFLFVRSWPGTVSQGTDRIRMDPRERLGDRAERLAAGLVDHYLRRVEAGEGHEYEVAKALAAAAGARDRRGAGAGDGRGLLASAEQALTLLSPATGGAPRPYGPRGDATGPGPARPGQTGRPGAVRREPADPHPSGRRRGPGEPGSGEPRPVHPGPARAESRRPDQPAGLERVGGERTAPPASAGTASAGPGTVWRETGGPAPGRRDPARRKAAPSEISAPAANSLQRPVPGQPVVPEPPTAGPHGTGRTGPHGAGPHGAGRTGPHGAGPHGAGPHGAGRTGPHGAGPHATDRTGPHGTAGTGPRTAGPADPPSAPAAPPAGGPAALPRVRPEWPAAPRPGHLIHRRRKRTVDYPELLTALRTMEEEPAGPGPAGAAVAGTTDRNLVAALRQDHIPYAAVGLLVREIAERYSEWGRALRRDLCETVLEMGLFVTSRPRPSAGPPPADETRAANAAALYHWAVRPLARDERISGRLAAVLPRLAAGADLAGRAAVDRILEQRNGPGLGDAVWLALLQAFRQDHGGTEAPGPGSLSGPAPGPGAVAVPGPPRAHGSPPPHEPAARNPGHLRAGTHGSRPPASPPDTVIPGPGLRRPGNGSGEAEDKDARVLVLSVVGGLAVAFSVLLYLLLAG